MVGVIVLISEPAKGLSFLGLLFKVKVKKKKKIDEIEVSPVYSIELLSIRKKKHYHLINP